MEIYLFGKVDGEGNFSPLYYYETKTEAINRLVTVEAKGKEMVSRWMETFVDDISVWLDQIDALAYNEGRELTVDEYEWLLQDAVHDVLQPFFGEFFAEFGVSPKWIAADFCRLFSVTEDDWDEVKLKEREMTTLSPFNVRFEIRPLQRKEEHAKVHN